MNAKTETAHRSFAEMPKGYAALCALQLPRPIHDESEYDETAAIAEVFAGFEDSMSSDQSDYFAILCTMLEAWDAEHDPWKELAPLEVLNHLLEESGLSGADLSRLLGSDRTLGNKILAGTREITAAHARTLGTRFNVNPGLFIGSARVTREKKPAASKAPNKATLNSRGSQQF